MTSRENGFRPEKKLYKLNFVDDEELAGLTVTVASVSVAEYNRMLRVAMTEGLSEETLEGNDWILDLFATRLESWNLLDPNTGKKVPPTKAGVQSQERTLIAKVITAWQVALLRVSPPLSEQSPNGAILEEQSLGLESESASPQS